MSLDGERMAALRGRFVAAAGEQADMIAAALQGGDLEAARALAHGLAGRSGLFGFAALGELARLADEADAVALPGRARELVAALRQVSQDR
jgi:HPt (histidine-containing phosphotransfer) domain-containing protein